MSSTSQSTSRDSTTACVLTASTRGAVAVIALQGNISVVDEFLTAANGKQIAKQTMNRIYFGYWGDTSSEEVVFLKPSHTAVEIHCHGGQAAVERILKNLTAVGVEIQSQCAWLATQTDAVHADCQTALLQATSRKAAHILLRQTQVFPSAYQELRELPANEAAQRAQKMLEWSEFGRHLLQPWSIVLTGRPNVGKSSLINALLGFERAVVYDQPGTTRDIVTGETAFEGWPVELFDTAGLRDTDSQIEAIGVKKAKSQSQNSDLTLFIVDATTGVTEQDQQILDELQAHSGALFIVWNKCDLPNAVAAPADALQVSAHTREGLSELMKACMQQLIPHEPNVGDAFPTTTFQIELLQRHLISH